MGLRAPRKKILGLPGSGQPRFGTLISLGIPVHLCHYCDTDTLCVTWLVPSRLSWRLGASQLRDTIDICKSVPEPWHALYIIQMKTMTLFWNYIFKKNGSFFPEGVFLQTGQCLVMVYLLLLHTLHDFCRRINVLSRSIFPRSHGFVQWKPRKNR